MALAATPATASEPSPRPRICSAPDLRRYTRAFVVMLHSKLSVERGRATAQVT